MSERGISLRSTTKISFLVLPSANCSQGPTSLRRIVSNSTSLIEAHTKKIHLLIVESSLTDYHHEHPEPTPTPGEYVFSFTPRKPGNYRVWADLRAHPLGIQEYAMADIPGAASGEPLTDRSLSYNTSVNGRNYELILPDAPLKVGRPASARLRITGADGEGFTGLEPVMAAFAHIVGFNEDYNTVLHMHPKGAPILEWGRAWRPGT